METRIDYRNASPEAIAAWDEEIVSADIIGNPHSRIVDGASTRVILNRVVRVLVWYDNEFG